MSDSLEFNRYVRVPFAVEVTVITEENIDEIAELVGEVKERNGQKYIALDRRIVPSLSRAYLGWFFTRMDDNYRCYSPKVFERQFVRLDDDGQVTFNLNEDEKNLSGLGEPEPVNVFDAPEPIEL